MCPPSLVCKYFNIVHRGLLVLRIGPPLEESWVVGLTCNFDFSRLTSNRSNRSIIFPVLFLLWIKVYLLCVCDNVPRDHALTVSRGLSVKCRTVQVENKL